MKTLLDFEDELNRVTARAHMLELALVHTNEAGSEGRYGDAIAQQAQDVANQLEGLGKRLAEIRKDLGAQS
jgi:hypothetical protein